MKRSIIVFALLILTMQTFIATAQETYTGPTTQPYGTVSNDDLAMTACDFEKGAGAEMLFEKGELYFGDNLLTITEEVHVRIKIFNDNGKSAADIHIPYLAYFGGEHLEFINGIQAETISLVDGKQVISKLDKKLIYTKNIDKNESEVSFTMPDVKPGSIIEYKYKWNTSDYSDFPDWYFQEKIPVRYSELSTTIPDVFYFRAMPHISDRFVKYTHKTDGRNLVDGTDNFPYNIEIEDKALANIPSLPDEPFMSSFNDNVEAIRFQLISVRPIGGFAHMGSDSWAKVGGVLADDDGFGGQLKKKLDGEETIIEKAKTLKTDDDKIAYIFNEVKDRMKWNGLDNWETVDGTSHAWDTKTGNSAEINLILYHLLKQSGLGVYPMAVSTRDHGKVDPFHTSVYQFNRTVAYIPVDSTKCYVLDATGKYNIYNETPEELLNSSGLFIDKSEKVFSIVDLKKTSPVRESIMVNAEIKPGGKLEGTAQISNTEYNRIATVSRYKTDGEAKYIDFLRDGDNGLKISSIKMDNLDVDTVPLIQNINFNMDLAGSDENYIYVNPSMFMPFKTNPFLSENRLTNVDFAYPRAYYINGMFKIPAGYKTDALPKGVNMVMPDKSFACKRMVVEQDGSILVRYVISFNVAEYSKDNYATLFAFFKKMNEMLAEQIVLKKS